LVIPFPDPGWFVASIWARPVFPVYRTLTVRWLRFPLPVQFGIVPTTRLHSRPVVQYIPFTVLHGPIVRDLFVPSPLIVVPTIIGEELPTTDYGNLLPHLFPITDPTFLR